MKKRGLLDKIRLYTNQSDFHYEMIIIFRIEAIIFCRISTATIECIKIRYVSFKNLSFQNVTSLTISQDHYNFNHMKNMIITQMQL